MTSDMTPARRVLAAVMGRRTDYVPPANPLTQTTEAMMGFAKAVWPKAHTDPKMMADLAAAPWELCGVEAAGPQFDVSLEAEVLGCRLDWNKPDRPPVTGPAYSDPKDITWPDDLEQAGRVPCVLGAIEILRRRYSGDLPIIPGSTAPFTVAGHIMGIEELVMMTATDPDRAHAAISAATDFCIEYGRLQASYGAHMLLPADPSSSGDLISPETYEEFVLPYHRRFARSVGCPKILHICGHTEKLLPHIRKSGMDCLSFDSPPVWYVRRELGDDMTCLGSLDVIDLMPRGTPQQVYDRTVQCIREGVHIVGTACGVSNAPLENIRAYVRACRDTPVPERNDMGASVRSRWKEGTSSLKGGPFGIPMVRFDQLTGKMGPPCHKDLGNERLSKDTAYARISEAVIGGRKDDVVRLTKEQLSKGRAPAEIVSDALMPGIQVQCERYDRGNAFVKEILMSNDAMLGGMGLCQERSGETRGAGKVMIFVAEGDLHDIGKNIVAAAMRAKGYDVIDLGRDVPASAVVSRAGEEGVRLVCGSTLMSTTRSGLAETAELLERELPEVPIACGGAAVSRHFVETFRNSIYTRSPMVTVNTADAVCDGKGWMDFR